MAFPTISMQEPVEDPCCHAFPYTVTDGVVDTSPCERCGTVWEDRDKGFNGCSIWSIPRDAVFGKPTAPDTFLSQRSLDRDPGWFNRG